MQQKLLRLVRSEADSEAQAEQIVTTRTSDAAVPATPAHTARVHSAPVCERGRAVLCISCAIGGVRFALQQLRQEPEISAQVQKQTSELDHEAVILQEPDPLTVAAWTHSCPGRFFYANSISSQMIFVSIKSDGRIPRCAGPAGASNRMCTS